MFGSIRDAFTMLGASVTASADGNRGLLNAIAIAIGITEQAVTDGNSYLVSTNDIPLTTGLESAVLFIRNKHATSDLNVSIVSVHLGVSDAPGAARVLFKKNSKTGTIIDNADVAPIIENKNFNKTNVLAATYADVYKGAEGYTVNGDDFDPIPVADGISVVKPTGSIVLAPGNVLAVTVTPPVGNGSMNVIAGVELFITD